MSTRAASTTTTTAAATTTTTPTATPASTAATQQQQETTTVPVTIEEDIVAFTREVLGLAPLTQRAEVFLIAVIIASALFIGTVIWAAVSTAKLSAWQRNFEWTQKPGAGRHVHTSQATDITAATWALSWFPVLNFVLAGFMHGWVNDAIRS